MLESVLLFAVAAALLLGSPGPAPLALAATSACYGIRATLPFLTGILSGLGVVILGAMFGVAALLEANEGVKLALQLGGAGYILYVALKIARAPVLVAEQSQGEQPGWRDGFMLNILNPKAYAAFLALFSQFTLPLESVALSFALSAILGLAVATVVDLLWVVFGAALRRSFSHPVWARALRVSFACLMLVSVVLAMGVVA